MIKLLFLILAVSFVTLFLKYRFRQDSGFLVRIFIAALAARIILATVIYLLTLAPGNNGYFSGDESVYYKKAVNIAVAQSIYGKNIFNDTPELNNYQFAMNLFPVFGSFLIYLLGKSFLVIKYFNAFLGALLPVCIFLLAKNISNNIRISKIAAILTAFWPSLLLWSSVGLKEPAIILLVSAFFYYYSMNQRRATLFYPFAILAVLVVLYRLQPNVAAVLIAALVPYWIFIFLKRFMRKEIIIVIFLCLAGVIFFNNQKKIARGLYEIAQHQALQYVAGNQSSARYELYPFTKYKEYCFDFYNHLILSSDFYRSDDISLERLQNHIIKIRWDSFLVSYCKGLIYAIFSPFVWNIRSMSQLMVYPQMVLWWLLVPCIFYGARWSLCFRSKETALLILFVAGIYSILAITEGNVGSVFRHREWVSPLCLILASIGINKLIFRGRLE